MTYWTVVTRLPRGRFMHPVANVPAGLDWRAATIIAAQVFKAHPELEVWYVTEQGAPGVWPEDVDNVLLDTGRRIPIRWDSAPQVTL